MEGGRGKRKREQWEKPVWPASRFILYLYPQFDTIIEFYEQIGFCCLLRFFHCFAPSVSRQALGECVHVLVCVKDQHKYVEAVAVMGASALLFLDRGGGGVMECLGGV